jgi:hypothetical protein
VFYLCLNEINKILLENNSSLIEVSTIDIHAYKLSSGIQGELPFSFEEDRALNTEKLRLRVIKNESSLNKEQIIVFKDVVLQINNNEKMNKVFFVDGPGKPGKPFLYNALIDKFKLDELSVVAVASSGIASLLLNGGCTAHSTFKIPIPIHETSTCGIFTFFAKKKIFTSLIMQKEKKN